MKDVMKECPKCKGAGEFRVSGTIADGDLKYEKCETCNGAGRIPRKLKDGVSKSTDYPISNKEALAVKKKFGDLLMRVPGVMGTDINKNNLVIYVDRDSTLALDYKKLMPKKIDGVRVVVKVDWRPSMLNPWPLTP